MEAKSATLLSVVIPAYNEAPGITEVVAGVHRALEAAGIEHEIIVVDDGSEDATGERAARENCRVLRNPGNKGYGYSILRGIEAARGERIAILDADGTYPPAALPELVKCSEDYDMVVGRRRGEHYITGPWNALIRGMFRFLVEFTAGSRIPDINSGFRVFRRRFVLRHRHALCTGYSFTTTITLIALLEGCHLQYVPIDYQARRGDSKVHWLRDTLRSLQIITEVILLYNPLKFFLLLGGGEFVLAAFTGWLWELSPRSLHPLWAGVFGGLMLGGLIFAIGGAAFAVAGQHRLPPRAASDAAAGKLPPREVVAGGPGPGTAGAEAGPDADGPGQEGDGQPSFGSGRGARKRVSL